MKKLDLLHALLALHVPQVLLASNLVHPGDRTESATSWKAWAL